VPLPPPTYASKKYKNRTKTPDAAGCRLADLPNKEKIWGHKVTLVNLIKVVNLILQI